MSKAAIESVLERAEEFGLPIERVSEEEATILNQATGGRKKKLGYLPHVDGSGKTDYYITLSEETLQKYRNDIELQLQVQNAKAIKTIKNCVLFMAVVVAINLIAGLILMFI